MEDPEKTLPVEEARAPHAQEVSLEAVLLMFDQGEESYCVYARTDPVHTYTDPNRDHTEGYLPRRDRTKTGDDNIAHWTVFPALAREKGFVKTVIPTWTRLPRASVYSPDWATFTVVWLDEAEVARDFRATTEYFETSTFTRESAFPLRCPNAAATP